MSGSGTSPIDHDVDRLVATRLAGFVTTLRDNAFAVGSREGEDATAVIAEGYGERPELLRSAFKHLFSTRKADWDKFDGIFDAFWLGRRVKSRSTIAGASKPANNPSLKSLQEKTPNAAMASRRSTKCHRQTKPPTAVAARAAWKVHRKQLIWQRSISAR